MENKICVISIGKFTLDDDYTFFENGKIERFYDLNNWNQNKYETLKVSQISEQKKQKLLQNCPSKHIKIITKILNPSKSLRSLG